MNDSVDSCKSTTDRNGILALMGQLARVDQRAASYKFESSDSTSKCNVDPELHPLSFC